MTTIYELSPSQFHQAAPLLSRIWGDRALIDSVLEGTRPARVFVDYDAKPTAVLLAEESGQYYVFGKPNSRRMQQFLADAPKEAGIFSREDYRFIFTQHGWPTTLDTPMTLHATRVFRFSQTDIDPTYWAIRTRRVAKVRLIDRTLLNQVKSGAITTAQGFGYPFLERVMRDGIGFVAVAEGKIVSAAWAGAASSWYVSLEMRTTPDYQKMGLATVTAARFIAQALEHRLTVMCTCRSENWAASSIALKLGFEEGPSQMHSEAPPYGNGFQPSRGVWHCEPYGPEITLWSRVSR